MSNLVLICFVIFLVRPERYSKVLGVNGEFVGFQESIVGVNSFTFPSSFIDYDKHSKTLLFPPYIINTNRLITIFSFIKP